MSELLQYKCPCCSGAIEFDSKAQKMKCPYCDTEFDVEALLSYNEDINDTSDDEMNWEESDLNIWDDEDVENIRVYSCKSCGGEIVGDKTTAATECPFCGNPVVVTEFVSGDYKPDLVIPFKLDKKAAKEGLMKHLEKKPLLPKVFKSENKIDEIKGIYVPFWLYNADVDADIKYRATRLMSWSDSKYIYTKTSHYSVLRGGGIGFENVPVDGSTKMPDDLMESIEPYDMGEAVDFQTAYLSGYFADKYDVSSSESKSRANERIKRSTEDEFARTVVGYSSVIKQSGRVSLNNGKPKYALLPVWLLNTTYKGEKYTFAMNGQTGKFVGNLPIDNGAYFKWLSLLSVGIGALMFGITYLVHIFG